MRRATLGLAVLLGLGLPKVTSMRRNRIPHAPSGYGQRERARRKRQIASGMLRTQSRGIE